MHPRDEINSHHMFSIILPVVPRGARKTEYPMADTVGNAEMQGHSETFGLDPLNRSTYHEHTSTPTSRQRPTENNFSGPVSAMTHKTFCRICEAACGLVADVDANGRLQRLRPDRQHPVSHGFVCAKGTRFPEVANHPDRLLSPLWRQPSGSYEALAWPEAMHRIAARLRPIIERYGPHAVGLYFGNPLAFNTLGTLAMFGFMRALGSRNVFTAGSQDCNNKFVGSQIVHGSPFIHPIPDFAHTDLAVMFGTNPAVSQTSFVPLEGGATVFDRLLRRGGRVLWVDPRRTESAQRWGEQVQIRPGADVFLLLALLHEFRHRYQGEASVEGLETILGLAAEYPPERAAVLSGIGVERIRDVATAICRAHRTTFHMSVGVNQGPFGTLCYVLLHALAYVSGNLDRRGGMVFHPLAVRLAKLAERVGVGRSDARSRVGRFPAVLDTLPGGILADEILTPGPERIRALIVVAGDPVRSIPGGDRLLRALQELELLVCVDLFRNTTGQLADVLLPATSWLERWDVASTTALLQQTSMLQYSEALCPAPGAARPEYRILADLSQAIGRPLFGSNTLARLWGRIPWDTTLSVLSGVLLWPARLFYGGAQGIPVPRPKPGRYIGRGPRTPGYRLRFWQPDLDAEKQRLADYARRMRATGVYPATAADDSQAPFALICRRRRLGHNSWLHSARRDGDAEEAAWMAPEDLAALGLPEGGEVLLQTEVSRVRMLARPVADIARGIIVVPHGLPDANVNALIPSGMGNIEPLSGQHRMTGIAVRVTSAVPENPAASGARHPGTARRPAARLR
jgi:anaerobic selenocysteine-containing dehydrogenase